MPCFVARAIREIPNCPGSRKLLAQTWLDVFQCERGIAVGNISAILRETFCWLDRGGILRGETVSVSSITEMIFRMRFVRVFGNWEIQKIWNFKWCYLQGEYFSCPPQIISIFGYVIEDRKIRNTCFLFFPVFIFGGWKLRSKLGLKNHFCGISRELLEIGE